MGAFRETERVGPLREWTVGCAWRRDAKVVDIRQTQRIRVCNIQKTGTHIRVGVIKGLGGGCALARGGAEQATALVQRRSSQPGVLLSAKTKFIEYCRRNGHRILRRIEIRCPVDVAEAAGRNVGLTGLSGDSPVLFAGHRERELVLGIQLIIKPHRQMVSIGVRALPGGAINSVLGTKPLEAPCVQTVGRRTPRGGLEVIGQGQVGKIVLRDVRLIDAGAVRVLYIAEYVERAYR